jgi:hypothetical protein
VAQIVPDSTRSGTLSKLTGSKLWFQAHGSLHHFRVVRVQGTVKMKAKIIKIVGWTLGMAFADGGGRQTVGHHRGRPFRHYDSATRRIIDEPQERKKEKTS